MSPTEVEALVRKGDEGKVVAAFKGLPETERRALAPDILRLYDSLQGDGVPKDKSFREICGAAAVAVAATAIPAEIAKRRWCLPSHEVAVDVLADRRPPWLETWAHETLAKDLFRWGIVRLLVQRGLVRKPSSDNWTLGFIGGGRGLRRYTDTPLRDVILADSDLREEVWKFFEVEGNQETSLAQHDKYSKGEHSWRHALVRLASEGELPRARLLDATLDALQRDFAQFRAGWYSQLHEDLQPTPEERAERLDRYLPLLGSRIPPTVSFALNSLQAVDKKGLLKGPVLLDHVRPALQARAKSGAVTALGLIERAVEREEGLRGRAADLVAEAVSHESAEVQEKALDVLDAIGSSLDKALREKLAAQSSLVAPSLRNRLSALAGLKEPAIKPAAEPALARPKTPAPLKALATVDEVLEGVSGAIERLESAEEFELALDGVLRFADRHSPDFERKAGPLYKRADALFKKEMGELFGGDNPRLDLCAMALAWITGQEPPAPKAPPSVLEFLSRRVHEVAVRAAKGRAGLLFALPTHVGGWIAPDALVRRAAEGTPDRLDGIQALLRLAPEGRTEALRRCSEVKGEFGAALQYALGGEFKGCVQDEGLWLAAARSRAPYEDEPHFKIAGPDGSKAAKYGLRLEKKYRDRLSVESEPSLPLKLNRDHVTILFHADRPRGLGYDLGLRDIRRAYIRWAATVWPAGLEAYFAAGLAALADNRDWWEARWWNRHYLEPLLRPEVSVTRMAALMLATGLACKEAGESGLATDVLIEAIRDGRLDGDALGGAMAELAGLDIITLQRWSKRLADAAGVSRRHAEVIRDALEKTLAGVPSPPPRDLGAALELLHELCAETGQAVTDPAARSALERLSSAGKVGRLARTLLA